MERKCFSCGKNFIAFDEFENCCNDCWYDSKQNNSLTTQRGNNYSLLKNKKSCTTKQKQKKQMATTQTPIGVENK